MPTTPWLSVLPLVVTIAIAIRYKRIIPALLIGTLLGGYLLDLQPLGGFEATVEHIVRTLTDPDSAQVLLFLFLFSGLIGIIQRSGGIQAFSTTVGGRVHSERGVFYLLWALIPATFIDCGFRIVGTGAITRSLVEKNGIARERLAFMLNNTASPVVELIPIATTYVGFNVANIGIGLKSAGMNDTSAYATWLHAIPLEFFSIAVIAITFLSIYFNFHRGRETKKPTEAKAGTMKMVMNDDAPAITPRLMNLVVPMLLVIGLSVFFFWYFGREPGSHTSFLTAITHTEPNRAMLVALLITIVLTTIAYAAQKYGVKEMTTDIIAGGNDMMPTLVILTLAWSLASMAQDLGLNTLMQQQVSGALPAWSMALVLFLLSATVTYFIGSGWGAASLIMPFAIPLAAAAGAGIPLCVAAVITGGTFGDVTSPVAGMTNMAANAAHADHASYLRYATPYNFIAAGIAAALFLGVGLLG
ncbi:MAG: Na+/H+ antiporter NhaC family protein [Flavobacteriales bacterium]